MGHSWSVWRNHLCPQAINTSSEAPLSCGEKGAWGPAVKSTISPPCLLIFSAFLPSFSEPFIRCQVIFTRRIKEKCGETVRVKWECVRFWWFYCQREAVSPPVSVTIFSNFCDNHITPSQPRMRRCCDFMHNYNSQWSERVDRCRRARCGSGERVERDQKSPGQAGAGNIWIRHKWIPTTYHRSLLFSAVLVEKTTQKNGFCSQMLWFEVIATASEKRIGCLRLTRELSCVPTVIGALTRQ